ncbi:outer membrane beta-barrel family protein [Rudanella lutea]|uniref:outer membrane beta-barrel family protein n=1 Tax=Rudanella lutea TaxID=451374 RepID=UPI0004884732|nr:outer membrane beta-barrel family protein [Rudanella lutea]
MKQCLLLACLLMAFVAGAQSLPTTGSGQGNFTVNGSVIDSVSRKPVEFATVALLGPTDGPPIAGDVTDASGRFSFANITPGRYRVRITFIGYEDRTLDPISVNPTATVLDLPPLLLRTTSRTLGEVTVTAQRDLIEDKEDRVVYNAGNDPSNAGGTAIDVMKKVPMLSVDPDGSIQLKGSSSIKVLINNKPSSIMARSIAEALQMIPAEAIKSVEVITAPSAKYDAEGTAGIINIITKNRLQGLVGGLNGTTGNRSHNVGGNINLKQGKVGLTAYGGGNLNLNDGGSASVRKSLLASQSVSELRQNNTYRNENRSVFGSFNLDYELDSTNQLGFDGSLSAGSRVGTSVRDTRYEGLQARQPFRRYSDNSGENLNYDFNFNYTRLFKRPEQDLTFLAQLNNSDNDSRYALDQYMLPENQFINYRERNTNLNQTSEFTLQTDYTHPFKKGRKTLEVGVKSIRRNVQSDFQLQNATDSTGFRDDPRRANQFDYRQWVTSAYTSFRITTSKRWTYTLGGRYEYTVIDANFVSSQTTFADQYPVLLPNVAISKRMSNNGRLRLSYNQRIQRPNIVFLNPFINSNDPKNLSFGNPYLDPERAHSAELTYSIYTKKGLSINTTLFGRMTNNAIERVTTVDTANVSFSTYQNIAKNSTYGLNLFTAGRPAKNWQLNGTVNLNYNLLNSAALRIQNRNWSYRLSMNSNLSLRANYSLQAQASYQSARIQLQGQSGGFYNYGVSARKEFKQYKVVLTVNAENFLSRYNTITNQFRTTTFLTDASSYNAFRNVRVTANWRFGRMNANKTTRAKKRIANDDGKSAD